MPHADPLAEFLSPPLDPPPPRFVTMERGEVTAFSATTVTLDWNGGTGYIANYSYGYDPVVGDRVLFFYGGGAMFVLGKIR